MEQVKGVSNIIRMPRLGSIRLGIKVKNAKGVEYPKATDYFVCPEEVQAVYGDKPTDLRVAFPLEDETIFAKQSYSHYTRTRGLVCRGNGETAMRLIDIKTGALPTEDSKQVEMRAWRCCPKNDEADESPDLCPEFTGQGYKAPQCRLLMQLQVLLPEVPGIGVWQISTGSFFGIVNLNSCLATLRTLTGGRVSMIPIRLLLRPQEVQADGKKKNVHVLQFVVPLTLSELQNALAMPPLAALLPAPEEPERDLDYAEAEVTPEQRLPDVERAKADMEMWDGQTADQQFKGLVDTPQDTQEAPEQAEKGDSGQEDAPGEKAEVTRQKIRNTMRKRWPDDTEGRNTAPFCQQWGADTVDQIPAANLQEALEKITPKGG